MDKSIVFIGGGNMAVCLINGLYKAGWPGTAITVIDRNADKRAHLEKQYGINTASCLGPAHRHAAVIVLAVKPQDMAPTARTIDTTLADAQPLILSIAAGIPLAALRQWLGQQRAYIRAMPNTPALVGQGATGLYADEHTTAAQRDLADRLMATVGINVWVTREDRLNAVIAAAGSAPAYFFAVMEAMIQKAQAMGLSHAEATQLVVNTGAGATQMARDSSQDLAELRRQVASKGGTTAAALDSLAEADLDGLMAQAMQAASDRAEALAQQLTQS